MPIILNSHSVIQYQHPSKVSLHPFPPGMDPSLTNWDFCHTKAIHTERMVPSSSSPSMLLLMMIVVNLGLSLWEFPTGCSAFSMLSPLQHSRAVHTATVSSSEAPRTTVLLAAKVDNLATLVSSSLAGSGSIISGATSTLAKLVLLLAPSSALAESATAAEVLNDVSHISSDLVSFWGEPGVITLRLAAVVGRLCTMAADYIPDQTMLPEEVVFQAFMLVLAVTSLVRAAYVPFLAACCCRRSSLTVRDGKTFRALFAPAGVSWRQYKAMTVSVLEWVHVREGDTLTTTTQHTDHGESDGSMYWLFDGRLQVESSSNNNKSRNDNGSSYSTTVVERQKSQSRSSFGGDALIGEGQLLDHVGVVQRHARKNRGKKAEPAAAASTKEDSAASVVLRVVSPDATVLCVHVSGLQQLMENDPELEKAMRSLLFQSMDAKLQKNAVSSSSSSSGVPVYHNDIDVTTAVQPIRAA